MLSQWFRTVMKYIFKKTQTSCIWNYMWPAFHILVAIMVDDTPLFFSHQWASMHRGSKNEADLRYESNFFTKVLSTSYEWNIRIWVNAAFFVFQIILLKNRNDARFWQWFVIWCSHWSAVVYVFIWGQFQSLFQIWYYFQHRSFWTNTLSDYTGIILTSIQ